MDDPVFVTIGGEKIELPPVANFAQLQRLWPAMKALDATQDIIERTTARLAIISAALKESKPELGVPELAKRLRIDQYDEMLGLIAPVEAFLIASGLVKARADAAPDGAAAGEATAGEAAPAKISPAHRVPRPKRRRTSST